MFRSATFKLTLWYLAIVMAISLIFSAVVYHVATQELARGLHRQTEQLFNQFPVFEGTPILRSGADYDDAAQRILLELIGFNIIVLIGAGFASYWLARRTLEPIEAAHEQQKRFTADVSHELRTPLTAIRMESEVALLNKRLSASELRQTLSSNLEEVAKLETLINNLLRLTRLEADELQQSFEVLDAKLLAESALDKVRPLTDQRRIKIVAKLQPALTRGDRDSLEQLLVILLDNAIKYSPGKSTITVSSRRRGHEAVLTVTDEGAGIKREDLEHVFDRFYRAENSRSKTHGQGFGLGLSIAKMIADIHGGNVTLTSRAGHGTTASVSLPLADDQEGDQPETDIIPSGKQAANGHHDR